MSLTADEKLRVVAPPRRARRPPHRGRLPGLEPQGGSSSSSCWRARRSQHAEIAAFGMTRRRDVAAERRPGPARARRLLRAGLHDRRQDLRPAPREGRARRARGEPGDDRRVGRVPRRRRASASSTTPSTSSTATRDDPRLRAGLPARGRRGGRRARRAVRHQRRRRCPARSPRRSPTSSRRCDGVARRHPLPQRRRAAAWPTRWPPSRPGATQVQGTMNGVGERTGNANLVTIIANLQLKLGHARASTAEQLARLTETAHFVDELLNRTPDPRPALRRQARVRPQGRHARRRRARRRRDLRAHRPGAGRQPPRPARLRARRPGHAWPRRPRRAGLDVDDDAARAIIERVKELEHARLPVRGGRRLASSCCCARRPASTSRCSAWSPGA